MLAVLNELKKTNQKLDEIIAMMSFFVPPQIQTTNNDAKTEQPKKRGRPPKRD